MSQFLDRIAMRSLSRLALVLAGVVATALLLPVPSRAAATREAKLTAAAGTAEAKFGTSVSISGHTTVVGAPDEGGTAWDGGMGAAYVFTKTDGIWTEQATLVAPVRTDGDKFGFGVAVDGDTAVVGAPNADELSPRPGAAYVFVRRGETWAHQATLTPSDSRPSDLFGYKVAVTGDTAVVGAPGDQGSAYVFTRTADVWTEQAKLTASDGDGGDGLGNAVAISGDTVIVGAYADDVGAAGIDQGSAYVFTRTGPTWTEQAKLTAADGSALEFFAESVAVFRDTVVVGGAFDDIGLNPKQGSAYVFVRDGESWAPQAKLTAPDGDLGDMFGRSVAVTAGTVAVGAHFDEGGGSVYLFNRVADAWSEPTKLTEAGAGLLGVSVAASGHTVIAGANFTKVGENGAQGAAYVFRIRPSRQAGTIGGGEGAHGYHLVAGDGGIFSFGDRGFHGSNGGMRLRAPIVGGATDRSDDDGYWMVAADGGVFSFGAAFHGSLGDRALPAPAVDIEGTPSGRGYWIALADGTVHAFGDAPRLGGLGGRPLNRPVIAMAATPTGRGYWLVAADGGIFTFGDAAFLGSMAGRRLNAPVIDLAPTPDGRGYHLLGRDGGVFTLGTAEYQGSAGAMALNSPVVAMLLAGDGSGYWLGAADGGVFTFGENVPYLGSMGGTRLVAPVLDLIH